MTPARRVTFWLMATLGVALAVSQLVLVVQTWNDPVANAYYSRLAALFQGIAGIAYLAVGLTVSRKRPDHLIGWLLAVIGLGVLFYQFSAEYATKALLVEQSPSLLAAEAAVISQTFWIVPFAFIPVVLLIFPTGRLLGRLWLMPVLLALVAIGLIVVGGTIALWPQRSRGAELLTLDFNSVPGPIGAITSIGLLSLLAAILASLLSIAIRWRRGSEIVRLQLKWLVLVGVIVALQTVSIPVQVAGGELTGPVSVVDEVLLQLGLIGIPIAIGLAVLRYRLFEIDRIISRTVTYAMVTVLLVVVYLGSVFLLRSLSPFEGPLPVAASTLAVAALFSPLRRRIQGVVDRRFNRSSYDAERALTSLSGRLREQIELKPLEEELAGFAQRTVQPATVSVWLR